MSAGYIVQDEHLLPRDHKDSRQWELAGHSVLVANPAIRSSDIYAVAPDCRHVLLSFNTMKIASAGPGNDFMDSLRYNMAPYVLKDRSGTIVRAKDGDAYFDWTDSQGAYAYAAWIVQNCHGSSYYLDDYMMEIPPDRLQDLPLDLRIVADYYPEWRERFIDSLRMFVPGAVIVGNLGHGRFFDKRLNGGCRERHWKNVLGKLMTLAFYVTHFNRGEKPTVSIDFSGEWDFPAIGLHRGVFFTGVPN